MIQKKTLIEFYVKEFDEICNVEIKGDLNDRISQVAECARYRFYQKCFEEEDTKHILMIAAGLYGKDGFYDAVSKLRAFDYAEDFLKIHRDYREWKSGSVKRDVVIPAIKDYLKTYTTEYHKGDGPFSYSDISVLNFITCIDNYQDVISEEYLKDVIEVLKDLQGIDWGHVIRRNPKALIWYLMTFENSSEMVSEFERYKMCLLNKKRFNVPVKYNDIDD